MIKNVLLVGAGPMAVDHYTVFSALGISCTVVGRSAFSAEAFTQKTGHSCIAGGLESYLEKSPAVLDAAVVAVGMEALAETTLQLIQAGYRYILVEKPAGMNLKQITHLAEQAGKHQAKVLIAYNRRFYASVLKAEEIIEADGGLLSFNFEFTEWAHTIEPLKKAPGVKEAWLLGNSTHVIDLAFFLGGKPARMQAYAGGMLSWHKHAQFNGAGVSNKGAFFSYQANWSAPGRWGVELLTANSRLYLRPMEELQQQLKGSVAIQKVEIDSELDKKYKPGLYLQNKAFAEQETTRFKTIQEQAQDAQLYDRIALGDR